MSRTGKVGALYLMGGGPTAVINRTLVAAVQEARRQDAFSIFYGAKNGFEGALDEHFADLLRIPDERLKQIANTPGAILGTTRMNPVDKNNTSDKDWRIRKFLEICKDYDIHVVLFNGGNDTAESCYQINRVARELRHPLTAVHLIKTIDNDLLMTDRCPGFLSAARHVANRARFLYHEVNSFENAAIVMEIMGRNAGWLTASTSLANFQGQNSGGPDIILLPEIPFNPEQFLELARAKIKSKGSILISVSEGISIMHEGKLTPLANVLLSKNGKKAEVCTFGNTVLIAAGVADFLVELLKLEGIVKRGRAEVLGYATRSDANLIAPQDVSDAESVGRAGIECALSEQSKSVILLPLEYKSDTPKTGTAELSELAGKVRHLDPRYVSEDGNTNQFFRDFHPLIEVAETSAPITSEFNVINEQPEGKKTSSPSV